MRSIFWGRGTVAVQFALPLAHEHPWSPPRKRGTRFRGGDQRCSCANGSSNCTATVPLPQKMLRIFWTLPQGEGRVLRSPNWPRNMKRPQNNPRREILKTEFARELRSQTTETERRLWSLLRRKQVAG